VVVWHGTLGGPGETDSANARSEVNAAPALASDRTIDAHRTAPSGPATPGHLLGLIRSRPVWTRQQLLTVTGMSRTTLFDRLDTLFRHRLIYEAGSADSNGGRPATLLRFDDRRRAVLVFDLGQTHGRLGVADLSGRTLRMRVEALDIAEAPQSLLPRLIDSAASLLADDPGLELAGIGMSVPGPVRRSAGTLATSTTMRTWVDFPIAEMLRAQWPVSVLIENDAHAFAVGESATAGPSVSQPVLAVKFASGIGAGIVFDDHVLTGSTGAAGDIGHIRISDDGPICTCGRRGCLAAWASGHALLGRLRSGGVRNLDDLVRRIERGEDQAVAAIDVAAAQVGDVLAAVVATINPGVVVMGGRLGRLTRVVSGIDRRLRAVALDRSTTGMDVVASRLGDEAVTVGLTTMVVAHAFAPEAIDELTT